MKRGILGFHDWMILLTVQNEGIGRTRDTRGRRRRILWLGTTYKTSLKAGCGLDCDDTTISIFGSDRSLLSELPRMMLAILMRWIR